MRHRAGVRSILEGALSAHDPSGRNPDSLEEDIVLGPREKELWKWLALDGNIFLKSSTA